MSEQRIYLDHAAATKVRSEVLEAMLPYFGEKFANPSAVYGAALHVKDDVEAARHSVAQVLGCKKDEVIFTAGATESINLAIKGVLTDDDHVIVSAVEHEAALSSIEEFDHSVAPVDERGILDMDKLRNLISDNTKLISIILASNEIGTIQPISAVSELVKEIKEDRKSRGVQQPLYVHSDASQAGLYLDLHVSRLGVDMLTLNGGKMNGPKQSGCLYVKSGTELQPLLSGGGQEKGKRSGTENVAFTIGFAKALELAQNERKVFSESVMKQRKAIEDALLTSSNTTLNGHKDKRLPSIINVSVEGLDGERAVIELDMAGVDAATGSACSASADEPSQVLLALGLSEDQASSSLRFSLGRETIDLNPQEISDKILTTITS